MNGYLSKPIRPMELDNLLQKYVDRRNERCGQFLALENRPSMVEAIDHSAELPLNIGELLSRVDNDQELLRELVQL